MLAVGDGRQEVWATVLRTASSLCTIASGGSIGTGQERPTGTMIQRRGLGTVGTTDAFITTATMAVVTNWVLLPLPERFGSIRSPCAMRGGDEDRSARRLEEFDDLFTNK